jgi:hypothetical protein
VEQRFDVPLVVPGRKYFQEGILQKMTQVCATPDIHI